MLAAVTYMWVQVQAVVLLQVVRSMGGKSAESLSKIWRTRLGEGKVVEGKMAFRMLLKSENRR
jgi:hypothetical protein